LDDSAYLDWDIPEFRVVLRLRRSALEEARQRSVAALKSLPRRGVETGGIVMGYAAPGLVEIEELREIPCAHLFGPSYRLTEEEAVGLFSDSGAEPARPIGLWRSNLREQGSPDAHDAAVTRESGGPGLILLLHPGMEGDARLVCCLPGADGAWDAVEAPWLVRPDAQALVAAPSWLPARANPAGTRSSSSRAFWWGGAAILVLILAAAIFALVRGVGSQQTATPYVDLGFRAERAGSGIRLTWQGALPVVASAYGGTLRINDGGLYRAVELTAAQTRAGSLVYSPQSDDIEFRLEIYGNGNRSYGEATRVILPVKP
jgi:hypothetical protein